MAVKTAYAPVGQDHDEAVDTDIEPSQLAFSHLRALTGQSEPAGHNLLSPPPRPAQAEVPLRHSFNSLERPSQYNASRNIEPEVQSLISTMTEAFSDDPRLHVDQNSSISLSDTGIPEIEGRNVEAPNLERPPNEKSKLRMSVEPEKTTRLTRAEWIPLMLRKRAALPFAALFVILIVILEVLDILDRRRHGFPTSPHSRVLASRYVPTIVAVVLSFILEIVVVDVKLVMPWKVTKRWASADHNLLANYFDDLELKSVWTSFRRRHWAMFIALLSALVCGLLVPFTNTLFYINNARTYVESQTASGLTRTSTLLVNNTISQKYSDRPLLAILGARRFNNPFPLWTTADYAFESFELSSPLKSTSGNLTANTLAWGANLDCATIQYDLQFPSIATHDIDSDTLKFIRLGINRESMDQVGCTVAGGDFPEAYFPYSNDMIAPFAWINATRCTNDGQYAILITAMTVKADFAQPILNGSLFSWAEQTFNITVGLEGNNSVPSYKVTDGFLADKVAWNAGGIICRPTFHQYNMSVTVNASTSDLLEVQNPAPPIQSLTFSNLSYGPDSNPTNHRSSVYSFLSMFEDTDAQTTIQNNFLSTSSEFLEYALRIQQAESISASYDDYPDPFLIATALDNNIGWVPAVGISSWFYMLSAGNASLITEYSQDPKRMATDSARLFSSVFAQLVNTLSRNEDSSNMGTGTFTATDPRLSIRPVSLRFLQGILFILCLAMLVCSTVLRPRTNLAENPGTLGAMAVRMANQPNLKPHFHGTATLDGTAFEKAFKSARVQIGNKTEEPIQIENITSKPVDSDLTRGTPSTHYRPITLRWYSRSMLIAFLIGCIVALGVLQNRNSYFGGFNIESKTNFNAWIYATNVILVLLGYAISGASTAIQSLQPYKALARNSAPAERSVLSNPVTHSTLSAVYHSLRIRRLTMFVCSLTILIHTAAKIVAAGLFVENTKMEITAGYPVTIDQSLVTNLTDWVSATNNSVFTTYRNFSSDNRRIAKSGLDLYRWIDKPSYHFASPPGIYNGTSCTYVFATLAEDELTPLITTAIENRGQLLVSMPAIKISPECLTFGPGDLDVQAKLYPMPDFGNYFHDTHAVEWQLANGGGQFTIKCKHDTPECRQAFESGGNPPFRAETAPNFNMTQPYFYDIHALEPEANSTTNFTARMSAVIGRLAPNQALFSLNSKPYNVSLNAKSNEFVAISCVRHLSMVDVNVTLMQSTFIQHGSTVSHPVTVASVDESSVIDRGPISQDNLTFAFPEDIQWKFSGDSVNTSTRGLDSSGNIATTFLDLLAKGRPVIDLTNFISNPQTFAKNVSQTLRESTAQILNELRPFLSSASYNNSVALNATLMRNAVVIEQDVGVTIGLLVLLCVILIFLVFAFISIDTESVIPKAPNSIGAQFSLLADSKLLETLRKEGVDRVKDTDLWERNRFALGWWGDRWGVDAGCPQGR